MLTGVVMEPTGLARFAGKLNANASDLQHTQAAQTQAPTECRFHLSPRKHETMIATLRPPNGGGSGQPQAVRKACSAAGTPKGSMVFIGPNNRYNQKILPSPTSSEC
jgi:hypothetical protein